MSKLKKGQSGFTVTELIITLAIIAVLGAVAGGLALGLFSTSEARIQADYEQTCYQKLKAQVGANPNYTGFSSQTMVDGRVCPEDMFNAAGTGLTNTWGGAVTVSVLGTGFEDNISFLTDSVEVESCSDFASDLADSARGVGIDATGSGTYTWVKDRSGFGGTIINDTQIAALNTACNDTDGDNLVNVLTYYR